MSEGIAGFSSISGALLGLVGLHFSTNSLSEKLIPNEPEPK